MKTIIKEQNSKKIGVRIALIIASVALLLAVGVVWATTQNASASPTVTKAQAEKVPATSYHYFNDDVQGSSATMYNLGPNRWAAGCTTAASAKADLLKSIDPNRGGDPTLAAAVIYYAQTEAQTVNNDINFTKINLTDRTEHNKDVEKAISDIQINVLGSRWTEDVTLWQKAYDKFATWLESTSMSVEPATLNVALAHQIPHSKVLEKEVPKIAWSTTSNVAGHWFKITTGGIELQYLLEEGYAFPADKYVAAGCRPGL